MKKFYVLLMLLVTLIFGCNNKILEKQYGNSTYRFKHYKLKSNVCIKNNLPWLDKIVQNKGMHLIQDQNFGEERFDYRFLDNYSFRLLYGNMNDLNTSECFATQKQFFDFFGKQENVQIYDDKYSESRKYSIFFININQKIMYEYSGIQTIAYFNMNGERVFIGSHYIDPVE